eukprot:12962507-Alexandrium_andersonii.AAC.1
MATRPKLGWPSLWHAVMAPIAPSWLRLSSTPPEATEDSKALLTRAPPLAPSCSCSPCAGVPICSGALPLGLRLPCWLRLAT